MDITLWCRSKNGTSPAGCIVTYIQGSDEQLAEAALSMDYDDIHDALTRIAEESYTVGLRFSAYTQMQEWRITRQYGDWQDAQSLVCGGDDSLLCLRELLALFYSGFHGTADWREVFREISGQNANLQARLTDLKGQFDEIPF